MNKPLVLVNKDNFWRIHLKEVYLLIDFRLELNCFLVFDLPFLKHLIDVVILCNQYVILSSSVLNGFANLWECVFNIRVHVFLSTLDILLRLKKDLIHKVFVLDNLLYHFCRLIMAFNKVYDDIVT